MGGNGPGGERTLYAPGEGCASVRLFRPDCLIMMFRSHLGIRCPVLLVLAWALICVPLVRSAEPIRETFSREYSVFVGGDEIPLVKQLVSRELSLFVGAEPEPPYRQFISREFSLLVTTPAPPARIKELTIDVSPTGDRAIGPILRHAPPGSHPSRRAQPTAEMPRASSLRRARRLDRPKPAARSVRANPAIGWR